MNRRTILTTLAVAPFLACQRTFDPLPAVTIRPKSFLWFGTSIPTAGGYAELLGRRLGAEVINNSRNSSIIRGWDRNHAFQGVPWQNIVTSLAHTIAEKEAIAANWGEYQRTQFIFDPPKVLTGEMRDYMVSNSYENLLLPYLNGEKPAPGYIVISHLYNDKFLSENDQIYLATPIDSRSRDTAIGAFNYLIDLIWQYQPDMPILIEGHYETEFSPYAYKAQELVAAYRRIPLLRLWKHTNWTQERIPGTQELWAKEPYYPFRYIAGGGMDKDMTRLRYALPDNVHPHTDPTGAATRMMTDVLIKEMRVSGVDSLVKLINNAEGM